MTARGEAYYRIISLVLLLSVWEIGGHIASSEFLLPPVSQVIGEFIALVSTSEFWVALYVSSQSLILGFVLAVLVGIPAGLMIGVWPMLDRLSGVYLILMLSTPIAPLVPLVVIIFGIGIQARVFIVFVFAVPMIIMNTATGVKEVSPSLVEMARSFGASDLTMFRRISLPGSLPAMMAGVRLGAGRAVVAMVVSELIIVSVGIGAMMMETASRFRTAKLFAVTSAVLFLGYLVVKTVQIIERALLKWRPST